MFLGIEEKVGRYYSSMPHGTDHDDREADSIPRVMLWSAPRTLSTCVERVLLESSAIEVVELVNVALDETKLAALRARRTKGRARLAQLVRQSFQRHDLDHNGYLDRDESAAFFLHYVDLVRARARSG